MGYFESPDSKLDRLLERAINLEQRLVDVQNGSNRSKLNVLESINDLEQRLKDIAHSADRANLDVLQRIRDLERSLKDTASGANREKLDLLIKRTNDLERRLNDIAHCANRAKNASWYALSENEIVASLYTGQFIIVDRRDISVAPSLILAGEWETQLAQFFRSLVKPGDTVFDIGANVGYFGLIAATENGAGAIHFFEVNPDLAALIAKTCQLNAIQGRCIVNNSAVARVSGAELRFQQPQNLWGSTSCRSDVFGADVEIEKEYTVASTSLDDYCAKRGDFRCNVVKIDVECFEEEVFLGMEKTIAANDHMNIITEYTHGAYSDGFFPYLRQRFRRMGLFVEGRGMVELKTQKEMNALRPPGEGWSTLVLQK